MRKQTKIGYGHKPKKIMVTVETNLHSRVLAAHIEAAIRQYFKTRNHGVVSVQYVKLMLAA